MALLDQRHRFESVDFSNHIIRAFQMDHNDEPQAGIVCGPGPPAVP
jgi:hypothetical protein